MIFHDDNRQVGRHEARLYDDMRSSLVRFIGSLKEPKPRNVKFVREQWISVAAREHKHRHPIVGKQVAFSPECPIRLKSSTFCF
jgi:hypothetical protein